MLHKNQLFNGKKMLRANWIFWVRQWPTGRGVVAVQVLKAIEDEPAINPPAGLSEHILQQKAAVG